MTLSSSAFADGQLIPVRFTGDGEDISPPLFWSDPPKGTREFVLICDDPHAPTPEPWVHWLLYNLPSNLRSLPTDLPKTKLLSHLGNTAQGQNSWGASHIGYRGPAPPRGHGTHCYHFKLFALDGALKLKPGIDKTTLLQTMQSQGN